jgi:hypothetical protein
MPIAKSTMQKIHFMPVMRKINMQNRQARRQNLTRGLHLGCALRSKKDAKHYKNNSKLVNEYAGV